MFKIQDFCKIVDKKVPSFLGVLKLTGAKGSKDNEQKKFSILEKMIFDQFMKFYEKQYETNYQEILQKNYKSITFINGGI